MRALALALCSLALTAGTARAADPTTMVLALPDMPAGSSVESERRLPPNTHTTGGYEREFTGVRIDGRRLFLAQATAALFRTHAYAQAFISDLGLAAGSAQGQEAIARTTAAQFAKASNVTVKSVRFVRVGELQEGEDSVDLVMAIATPAATFEVGQAFVRVDRAVTSLYYAWVGGKITRASIRRLLKKPVDRMVQQLLTRPVNAALPTVDGTARVGGWLFGSAGSWKPFSSRFSFVYQWERCGSAGGGCTPVPGATSLSHQVVRADVGHRLAISVRASNAAGNAAAVSAPSAVVAR